MLLSHNLLRQFAIIILSLSTLTATWAQEEEDFDGLVRRSLSATNDSLQKDSNYVRKPIHGSVYVGNNSMGRILPSGFFTYSKGRIKLTGDVALSFSDFNSYCVEKLIPKQGSSQYTSTDTHNRNNHEDLKLRLDYRLTTTDILSLDVFQKYYRDHTFEEGIQQKFATDGTVTDALYENQNRIADDYNGGVLLEHLHNFTTGGSLTTRAYFKHDNRTTDITNSLWGTQDKVDEKDERQTYSSSAPKAQIIYLSPQWHNLSFGLREKVGITNMKIKDSVSRFGFRVGQTLSSFALNWTPHTLALGIAGGYETYHHHIDDHRRPVTRHTYRDWIYNANASWKITDSHKLMATFDHNIARPTYTQLYPFIHIGSSIASWVTGNPNLKPTVTNQLQGNYTFTSKPLTLNAIVTYISIKDDITTVRATNFVSMHPVKTWINDARHRKMQYAIEGELRQGAFSMSFGARAQHIKYKGQHVADDKAWSYSFKVRPMMQLPHQWQLSFVALYAGRETHLHWYNQPYTYLALRAQKRIGAWELYAFAQDLLREKQTQVLTNTDGITRTENDYNTRALVLGVSYTF